MLPRQFFLLLVGVGLIEAVIGEDAATRGYGERVVNYVDYYMQNMASGSNPKKDAAAQLQPYSGMEKQLVKAPLAVGVLGKIRLIASAAKFRDFALLPPTPPTPNGAQVRFERLKWPGSYTASMSQISFEGWQSFQQAHLKMYAIEQKTAFFKNFMEDAMNAIMLPDEFPKEIKEELITTAFNGIMDIANKSEKHVIHVVDSFTNTSLTIQEMISSVEATKGNKQVARDLTKLLITQREYAKNQTQMRLAANFAMMIKKEIEAKIHKQKWYDAQEEAREWTNKNEPLYDTKETPIYQTILTERTIKEKKEKYSAYRNKCIDPCVGDQLYCMTIDGSQPCSKDSSHSYRKNLCKNECATQGEKYYWCNVYGDKWHQKWGYCSPDVKPDTRTVLDEEKIQIGTNVEKFVSQNNPHASISIPPSGFMKQKETEEPSEFDKINHEILKLFKDSMETELSNIEQFFDSNTMTLKHQTSISMIDSTVTSLNNLNHKITERMEKGGDKMLVKCVKNLLASLDTICTEAKNEKKKGTDSKIEKIGSLLNFLGNKKKEIYLVNTQDWEQLGKLYTDAFNELQDSILSVKTTFAGLKNIFDHEAWNRTRSDTTQRVANANPIPQDPTTSQQEQQQQTNQQQSGSFFNGQFETEEVLGKVDNAMEVLERIKPEFQKIGFKGNNLKLAFKADNKTAEMIKLLQSIKEANDKTPEEQKKMLSNYKEILESYQLWIDTIALLSGGSFGISKAEAAFTDDTITVNPGFEFEAEGKYAQEIVNAYAMAYTNQLQFEKLRDDTDKAFQQTIIESKKEESLVLELMELDAKDMTLEEILKALRKGFNALNDLQKNWKDLLTMFGEIKTNIQESMKDALKIMGDHFMTNKGLKNEFLKYVKETIYRNLYTASIHVYLVQKQANLYHKVSERILMPALSDLHKMNNLDANYPEDRQKIEEYNDELAEKTKGQPVEIRNMIELYEGYFSKRFDDRLESVSTLVGEMENLVPEQVQQNVQDQVDDTAGDLGLTPDDVNDNTNLTPIDWGFGDD